MDDNIDDPFIMADNNMNKNNNLNTNSTANTELVPSASSILQLLLTKSNYSATSNFDSYISIPLSSAIAGAVLPANEIEANDADIQLSTHKHYPMCKKIQEILVTIRGQLEQAWKEQPNHLRTKSIIQVFSVKQPNINDDKTFGTSGQKCKAKMNYTQDFSHGIYDENDNKPSNIDNEPGIGRKTHCITDSRNCSEKNIKYYDIENT
ncbi:hypothetical protein C1646_671585 [Rhizophagus diaphanus]|nr:hypothetical protein C1646_671585 [Rhizophagus diaphanus] [Rhizophagus sp. MUCL 43196]